MPSKMFKKADLIDKLGTKDIVENKIVDTTRWSVLHEIVFCHEGKFYESGYSVGATESQDERPYEYDPDEIKCCEVHEVEKVVKVWERV